MANRAQFYEQMAARTAEQITGSYQEWTAFLATASINTPTMSSL